MIMALAVMSANNQPTVFVMSLRSLETRRENNMLVATLFVRTEKKKQCPQRRGSEVVVLDRPVAQLGCSAVQMFRYQFKASYGPKHPTLQHPTEVTWKATKDSLETKFKLGKRARGNQSELSAMFLDDFKSGTNATLKPDTLGELCCVAFAACAARVACPMPVTCERGAPLQFRRTAFWCSIACQSWVETERRQAERTARLRRRGCQLMASPSARARARARARAHCRLLGPLARC